MEYYYNTNTLDKNKREPRYNYMTWTQKKEVVLDINETGLYLLEFYYSKSGFDYDYSDEKVSNAIAWTITKTRDYRLKLQKFGYFKQRIIRDKNAASYNTTLGHERWSKR